MNSVFEIDSTETRTSLSSERGRRRGHDHQPATDALFTASSIIPAGEHGRGCISGRAGVQEPGTDPVPSNADQRRTIRIDPAFTYNLNLVHGVMLVGSSSPACRPNFGAHGRTVRLRANHFPVHSIPDVLYEYYVEISPMTSLRSVCTRVYQLAEQTTLWEQAGLVGTVVHDAASRLISLEPLPHPLEIQVHYHEEGTPSQNARLYTLTIKFVKALDMGNLIGYIQGRPGFRNHNISSAISALNLVQLAARGNELRRPHVLDTENTALGGGLEARKGFTMTLRPARGQLTVRVDLTTISFYVPGNLATWMMNFQNSLSLRMARFIPRMMVMTTHTQSRKRIKRLSAQNSNSVIFETREFGQVTITQYFALRFGIQLQFPHLPLAEFNINHSTMLPPELCTILPNQRFLGKLLDVQDSAMSRITRVSPNANGEVIQQLGQQPVGPMLASCGMNIGPDVLEILGRVLPKPAIIYSANTVHVNDRAQWGLRDAKFVVGAHLDQWAVLLINGGYRGFTGVTNPELKRAVSAFRNMCNDKGMNITRDPIYAAAQLPLHGADPDHAIAGIRATLVQIQPKPQAILVVLASGDVLVYQIVKHLCDVILDVTTICVLPSKFRVPRPQYLASLALKFNMKLGGINHKLDAESVAWLNVAPTMVVGIDVLHPVPGDPSGTPSIAAVVASVDEHLAQYPASLSFQCSYQELITDLRTMIIHRLRYYQSRNDGKLPERVLVYRNSISETMFKTLLSTEVPKIMDAFQSFDMPNGGYRPKLALVICCKNQRTWFWVDGAVGDGNPEPGTVVDSGVMSAYNFDFYLQAHGGVSGTARPTLYTVIYNEMGAKADEIQGATHALSYMYAPATHAVSLAAPAHYADIACKHARCYLWKLLQRHSDTDDEETVAAMEEVRNMGEIPGWSLSSTMFYI